MLLNYKKKEKVKVSMVEYMDKILQEFHEEINRMALLTAVDYLFHMREESEAKKLEEERAIVF